MGLIFFKQPGHRVFNYQPLFYNERKERLDKKIEEAEMKSKGEYVPGANIRGSFQKMRYESKRGKAINPAKKVLNLLTLAIIIVALLYFIKYYGLLF
jgi:hypothetical protein